MRRNSQRRGKFLPWVQLLALALAMFVFAACGLSGSGNASGGNPDSSQVADPAPGTEAGDNDSAAIDGNDDDAPAVIAVEAWVGRAPQGDMTAAYFTIINDTDDTVVLTSVDAEVAGVVEIHETRTVGEDGVHNHDEAADDHHDAHHEHDQHDHSAIMFPVDEVEVHAQSEVAFEPGGLHVMLMELHEDLNTGDVVALELHFADGRVVTVDAEVR